VHIIKGYVGVEVELQSFLISALALGEQSASTQGHFTPVERSCDTCVTGRRTVLQVCSHALGEDRNVASTTN